MRNLLYRQLVAFLREMKNPDDSPVFKYIDLWTENTDFGSGTPGFKMPGIFIEFAPADRKTFYRSPEAGKDNIRFHLVTPWYSPNEATETTTFEQSIDWLGLTEQLCNHLSSFTSEDAGSFSRIHSSCSRKNIRVVEAIEEYTLKTQVFSIPAYVFDDTNDIYGATE